MDDLARYLSEMDTPGLSAAEERALIVAAQAGDTEAAARVVRATVLYARPLVRRLAKAHPRVDPRDLLQSIAVALYRALPRFDVTTENRFWTYGAWWALSSAQKHVAEAEVLAVPSPILSLDLPLNRQIRRVLSLDQPLDPVAGEEEADGATLGDVIPSTAPTPEEEADKATQIEDMLDCVSRLPARERAVIVHHQGLYGHPPLPTREIGTRLGISGARVRQLIERAMARIRGMMRKR